jgi:hypothetical protein
MLTRIRVLGLAVLVAGICAVAVLAQAGGAAARSLSAQAGFVPRVALPSSLASTRTAASVTAGMNWVDGALNENATFLSGLPPNTSIGMDAAFMSYYAYTDSSGYPNGVFPQAGDIYYMAVVLTVIGNPGGGGEVANDQIQLPSNTSLAIDSTHPTYCYFYNSVGTVLSRPTCPSPSVGGALPISLGGAPIASYDTFEEDFPVRTTVPLNGLCSQTWANGSSILGTVNPACVLNYNDWAIGRFSSTKNEFDYEGIWDPAQTLDTSISSKPASSTTSTSASFAFSSNTSGATFDCALDSGSWAACSSPKAYSGLTVGNHAFKVRADSVISYDGIAQTRRRPAPAGRSRVAREAVRATAQATVRATARATARAAARAAARATARATAQARPPRPAAPARSRPPT